MKPKLLLLILSIIFIQVLDFNINFDRNSLLNGKVEPVVSLKIISAKADPEVGIRGLNTKLIDTVHNNQGFIDLWKTVLTLSNIAVVIFLLYISFATIFHINIDLYGVKKALPAILIGVVMANFSYFISRSAVEISGTLNKSLINSVQSLGACKGKFASSPGDCFADAINGAIYGGAFSAWMSTSALAQTGTAVVGLATFLGLAVFLGVNPLSWGLLTFAGVFIILLLCIFVMTPAILLLFLSFLLIIRNYIILILIAISPAAFLCVAWDPVKSYFKQWWTQFFRWTIMAPAVLFLLWLAIIIKPIVAEDANLASYSMTLLLIYLATQIPFKLGGGIMSAWAGFGKGLVKMGWKGWGLGLGAMSNKIEEKSEIAKRAGNDAKVKSLAKLQQIVSLSNVPFVARALKFRKEALEKKAETGGLKYSRFEPGKFEMIERIGKRYDGEITDLEKKQKYNRRGLTEDEKKRLISLRERKKFYTDIHQFAGKDAYRSVMDDIHKKSIDGMPFVVQNAILANALKQMLDADPTLEPHYKELAKKRTNRMMSDNLASLSPDQKKFYDSIESGSSSNQTKFELVNKNLTMAELMGDIGPGGAKYDNLIIHLGKDTLDASGIAFDPEMQLRWLTANVMRNARMGGTSQATVQTLWDAIKYNPQGPHAPHASPSASSSASTTLTRPERLAMKQRSEMLNELKDLDAKKVQLGQEKIQLESASQPVAGSPAGSDNQEKINKINADIADIDRKKTTIIEESGLKNADIDSATIETATTDPEAVQNQYLDKLIEQISLAISEGIKEGFAGLDLSQIQVDTGKAKLDAETALRPFQLATLSRVNDLKEKVFRMRMLRSLKNIATGLSGQEGVSEETVNNEINNIESNIDQSFAQGEVPTVEKVIENNPTIKKYLDSNPKQAESIKKEISNYINITATENKLIDHDFEPAMELMRAPMHSMVKEASVPEPQASANPQVLPAPEVPQTPTSFGKDVSKPQEQKGEGNRFEATEHSKPQANEVELKETPDFDESQK